MYVSYPFDSDVVMEIANVQQVSILLSMLLHHVFTASNGCATSVKDFRLPDLKLAHQAASTHHASAVNIQG